jgi:outer membrane biosynthesis protein TonB
VCSLGTLAAGDSVVITIRVVTVAAGSFDHLVTASATENDLAAADDSSIITISVQAPAPTPTPTPGPTPAPTPPPTPAPNPTPDPAPTSTPPGPSATPSPTPTGAAAGKGELAPDTSVAESPPVVQQPVFWIALGLLSMGFLAALAARTSSPKVRRRR